MIKDCVKRNNKKKWSGDNIDSNWYKCLLGQEGVREKNKLTKWNHVIECKKQKNKNKLSKKKGSRVFTLETF